MSVTRRTFVKASGLFCSLCVLSRPTFARRAARGCSLTLDHTDRLQAKGIGVVGKDLSFSTGNPDQDKSLGRALVRLSQTFDERPGFGFIDDSAQPNAYATEETMLPGTRGTVLFGQTLFEDLFRRFDDGGIAVLAVAAHEFGHIAQYHRSVFDTLSGGTSTRKRTELHADLLAGYFLGLRKLQDPSIRLRTAGVALYEIGDYAYNDPEHHGTPKERVAAGEQGYKLANDGESFGRAFENGMNWVLDAHSG